MLMFALRVLVVFSDSLGVLVAFTNCRLVFGGRLARGYLLIIVATSCTLPTRSLLHQVVLSIVLLQIAVSMTICVSKSHDN
ncbi:hypothetical protein BDP55DRAFT_660128 [Colletotrichum godetiae]|uniref:Uncharacterized protein n=1 Tax=Colletotrichum godetiae TaxID=1209918 RepID=A0AAJ0ANI4_9PEZI|nr:uncharacterized protein BDP55DRAFT_660128 [Colletotrichum godetiae]KAK1687471.1 hypothetical protein BDP55DRAFT_660128 [Colletotrichum godetiae]